MVCASSSSRNYVLIANTVCPELRRHPNTAGYRTKRVKDAKTEAQKEIEEYRRKKEEEFKKFEAEQTSGNKKAEDDANKEAEAKVKEIDEAGKKHGKKVVDDLIKAVTTPHPQVPDKVSVEE
ncbi:hypothetical protein HRR75_002248 [Exophiala dermatitidis]|nr:hypothetical protein HRR75_002248 [Exophiala dermatitidis]